MWARVCFLFHIQLFKYSRFLLQWLGVLGFWGFGVLGILVLSIVVYIVYSPRYVVVHIHYYLLLNDLLLLMLTLRCLLGIYSYYCLMFPYCWKSALIVWFSLIYQILLVYISCSLLLGLWILVWSLVLLGGSLLWFYFVFLGAAWSYWAVSLYLVQIKLLSLLLCHVRRLNC